MRMIARKQNATWVPATKLCNLIAAKPISDASSPLFKDTTAASSWNVNWVLDRSTRFASFVSLLKRCGQTKALNDGRLVHAHIKRYKYDRNTFLGNWLVRMYGDCGSMEEARAVFDDLPYPDLFSWTVLMKSYTKNGYGREALECFRQMQLCGNSPVPASFVCALNACASLAALEKGRQIHAAVVGSGYEGHVTVGSALVNMYGKCRSLEEARSVFGRLPDRNVVCWNAMISACSQNGHAKEALSLFDQMQGKDLKPDPVTFVCALDACASLGALAKGQEIHVAIVDSGCEGQVIVGTALVNLYGKCGRLENARTVFGGLLHPNVVCWSAMIKACIQNGNSKEALDLLDQMQCAGIMPDHITYVSALDACASLPDLEKGQVLHTAIIASGYEGHITVGNSLINMYGKCGSLEQAKNVFHQMPRRNEVSWSSIIAACAQNGHGMEALVLFSHMQVDGFKPDHVTFVCTLDACTALATLERGQMIHASIVDSGYEGLVVVGTALVNMYGRCGSFENARNVFDRMSHRNVITWNAMIAACARNGHCKEALNLFNQMQAYGFKPDEVTFVSSLDACASLADLETGKKIHVAIIDSGYDRLVPLGNALVNMYGKCGCLQQARRVFGQMPHWNVISWNSIIVAYAQNGHGKEALQLFHEMQYRGVKPDQITFLSLLGACSHMGSVFDGRHYFQSMIQDHGIVPRLEHYVCMIDLLGRAGNLDEAENLITNLPVANEVSAWLCLLGACRIHGDVERGVRAANRVFKLDPENVAPYVLLSNIYATACG
ncbi:hypothetical protein O6H91_16G084700 [Diphasiastrum complanatum]|uniref:Uncharacterized protein n=2 Tax=Diphasiastrum complanatum TaxID=34168 RepID=A0ACC2BEK3_DIPCM|nr:hypothetical protein O6H91_16G081200 [Diphasiastrum complanatum]KAJ7528112.1 hypothetical protein O6H91_16G084700 [Diphasiastrum complanatum]